MSIRREWKTQVDHNGFLRPWRDAKEDDWEIITVREVLPGDMSINDAEEIREAYHVERESHIKTCYGLANMEFGLHLRLAEAEETIERLEATISAVVVRIDRMQDKRP